MRHQGGQHVRRVIRKGERNQADSARPHAILGSFKMCVAIVNRIRFFLLYVLICYCCRTQSY